MELFGLFVLLAEHEPDVKSINCLYSTDRFTGQFLVVNQFVHLAGVQHVTSTHCFHIFVFCELSYPRLPS